MLGVPQPGGGLDKQTNWIIYDQITNTNLRYAPFAWDFTDSGWDIPIPIGNYKMHYRVLGRVLRDQ